MSLWFENALGLAILLAIPALIQWRWRRSLALFCVALLVGLLTTIVAYMPLNGPGDAAVGRGWLVIYGMMACFLLTVIAAVMFIWSASRTKAAAGSDMPDNRESVEMFNRATQSDDADG